MSTYSAVLAAGEMAQFPGGASFQILSASAPVSVQFIRNGQVVGRADNVPASYYFRPGPERRDAGGLAFDLVKLTAGAAGAVVQVDVSDGDSGTNILSGTVNVQGVVTVDPVQPEEYPVFYEIRGVGAVSGQYGQVLMINPEGSGKTRYVREVVVSLQSSGAAYISAGGESSNADLTTAGFTPHQSGVWYRNTVSANLPADDWSESIFHSFGSTIYTKRFENRYKLEEGQYIAMRVATTNLAGTMCVEWEER